MYSALSTLNTTTEVRPLSKAPNPQLLPGHRGINGCPLLRVCVHVVCVFTAVCVYFGWVNSEHEFRVWVTILGRMSRHFHYSDPQVIYMTPVCQLMSCEVKSCLFVINKSIIKTFMFKPLLFELSFWRHPFTTDDPLVSKWYNVTFSKSIPKKKKKNEFISWMPNSHFCVNFTFNATLPMQTACANKWRHQ